MIVGAAIRTRLGIGVWAFARNEFRGHDSCWYRNDAVTHNHDDGRDELTQRRNRRDVAKTDRGQGDDCPVNAYRDVREAAFRAFHHIHNRPQDDAKHQNRKDKHQDFGAAFPQRYYEQIARAHEMNELQDAEDAQQADGTQRQQEMPTRKKQIDVAG